MQIGTRVAINANYGPCHVGKQGTVTDNVGDEYDYPIEVEMDDGNFWLFSELELDIL